MSRSAAGTSAAARCREQDCRDSAGDRRRERCAVRTREARWHSASAERVRLARSSSPEIDQRRVRGSTLCARAVRRGPDCGLAQVRSRVPLQHPLQQARACARRSCAVAPEDVAPVVTKLFEVPPRESAHDTQLTGISSSTSLRRSGFPPGGRRKRHPTHISGDSAARCAATLAPVTFPPGPPGRRRKCSH